MGHCKGGPHMSAELADMPLTKDMTGGRPACIINAGARSRMGGQPQMGHSPAEMGHSPAEMNYSKSMAMKKMPMVKGPDGKMVPEFAVDGKGKS